MKQFKGKTIYNPSGKAGEYSYWAVNFYNGCSARCEYCYNRHGITAKVLGADKPTLKKCLCDKDTALEIFIKEVDQNLNALRESGLFFNFVSDPFLKETIELNMSAILYCLIIGIPVKTLTKQTWWIEEFLKEFETWDNENPLRASDKHLLAFGFTLTGHDELEPGAASNKDRIRVMEILHNEGFKTWASIEPIIDFESSLKMIEATAKHCDLFKIGLQSGKKYNSDDLLAFMDGVYSLSSGDVPIYFKDSIIKTLKLNREMLPENCVSRDFNLFK